MTARDESRFKTLKAALADLGPFRRGTVLCRFMPCGKAGCRCQGTPPTLHGPYYEWTRKERGKTVTVRLTKPQARLLKQWIANGRRLDRIIAAMTRVSYRITERLFQAARTPPKA